MAYKSFKEVFNEKQQSRMHEEIDELRQEEAYNIGLEICKQWNHHEDGDFVEKRRYACISLYSVDATLSMYIDANETAREGLLAAMKLVRKILPLEAERKNYSNNVKGSGTLTVYFKINNSTLCVTIHYNTSSHCRLIEKTVEVIQRSYECGVIELPATTVVSENRNSHTALIAKGTI